MKKPTITGVQRSSVFSPNHIGNDASIFNGVTDYIREQGFPVININEQELITLSKNPERVYTMMRDLDAIKRMQQWESEGCRCVNSAFGIENCGRERMTKLLMDRFISYPDSVIVHTNEQVMPLLEKSGITSCWIKRSDYHALHREDVTYARNPEEVQELLVEYALRRIDKVVINTHLEGDMIKFYGVANTSFFYWFYPYDKSHSKFGWEEINGKAKGIPFDRENLRELCYQAADILNLIIYGGDCIVSPDGTIHIIDFNDWPSFAPCRKEAIPVIGEAIIRGLGNGNSIAPEGCNIDNPW